VVCSMQGEGGFHPHTSIILKQNLTKQCLEAHFENRAMVNELLHLSHNFWNLIKCHHHLIRASRTDRLLLLVKLLTKLQIWSHLTFGKIIYQKMSTDKDLFAQTISGFEAAFKGAFLNLSVVDPGFDLGVEGVDFVNKASEKNRENLAFGA